MKTNKMKTNKTKIIFNEKLKKLYDNIHLNHSGVIYNLSDITRSKIANIEMRHIFDNNIDNMDIQDNRIKLSKSDYFALITGLKVNYKECEKWEEILNYFDDIEAATLMFENDYEESHFDDCNIVERMGIIMDNSGNEIRTTCICSQQIQNIYYLKKNGEIKLIIGSTCLTKNIIINKHHPLYNKYIKETKKIKNQKQKINQTKEEYKILTDKYRKCLSCNEYNIDINESIFKKKCINCFTKIKTNEKINEKMKKFNKCDICEEFKIKKQDKFKICYDCLITEYNKCLDCKKYKIKKNSSFKLCYGCNMKK